MSTAQEKIESDSVVIHQLQKIDEMCNHDWSEDADGNPERCNKCGISFIFYLHLCCE